MMAPTTETADPKKMDQRRPNLSLNAGIKGSAQIAPREYDAETIPVKDGLSAHVVTDFPALTAVTQVPKSTKFSSYHSKRLAKHTFLPWRNTLQTVDELGV